MPRPSHPITLDFSSTDQILDGGGTIQMRRLASQHNVSVMTIKKWLSEHYGTNIVFLRGRYGGVRRSVPAHLTTYSENTSSTPTPVTAAS